MPSFPQSISLAGRRGIVLGIANEASIAWGCAKAMHAAGAELALSYLNEKARPHVQRLAAQVAAPIFLPCDVEREGELEALFAAAAARWGGIDFFVHSIAYAPKEDLQGRVVDASRAGFLRAMDVSCHSFIVSDAAASITGGTLHVDGGYHILG